MAKRQAFLLRLPPELLDEVRRLAAREMRSANGQIEYMLRAQLRQRGVEVSDAEPDAPTPKRRARNRG